MKWISTKEALPEKSGDYLVACAREFTEMPYYFSVIPYSATHKAWNAHDDMPLNAEYVFDDVTYWMNIPNIMEEFTDDASRPNY